MILLRLISWPYVRKHLARSLLTLIGIILGVAVFTGMHTANESVLFAFHKTIDQIAGATQLQVSAGETGFSEEVLEKVQALPAVRVAVPVIEAVVGAENKAQGNLMVLGIDMTGDRSLRSYDLESGGDDIVDDPLLFLAQPDSIILTKTFAQQTGLRVNSKLPIRTMEGMKTFTVRGIMKSGGLASSFGGNLAIMDIYAAQKVFGRGRTFDRIDLGVQEGLRPEDVAKVLQAQLGPGLQVELPSARGAQFESLSRIYALTANITSLFALFIGLFIIFNTFSIAVAQRRNEIGILRALGATRGQIRTLFITESAVTGLIGSLLGIGCGMLIARGIAGYIGGLLGEIYGIAQKAEDVSADPTLLAFALLIGVATSVLAGLIPARNASQVDPVQALQKGRFQMVSARESRVRRIIAAFFMVGSLLCAWFSTERAIFYTGYLLCIVAALLLTPTLCVWLSQLLRPVMQFLFPVEGTLAADSLIQSPRRTSGAVAALMLSLGLAISLAGMARASYDAIQKWVGVALNPDLFVSTASSLTHRSFRFPLSLGDDLRKVQGIDEVQAVRTARTPIDGRPVMLVAGDLRSISARAKLPTVAGNTEEMYRRAARGEAVLASDNLALLHGYKLGDTLEIASPSGNLRLPIAGIVTDFSDQQGSVIMDLSLYRRNWRDETANLFRVYLKRGEDIVTVKRRILDRFTEERLLFVLTNGELRSYILGLTEQWFGLTYIQIAVAVLVAILGIVNTLTVSITDRRRELGILQAVGALRFQVRATIWLEAVCIGIVGLTLGLLLGAAQLYYSLEVSRRDMAGLRLEYQYPNSIALMLLPVILGVAFLAALGPAEAAVRGSLVEALEYE